VPLHNKNYTRFLFSVKLFFFSSRITIFLAPFFLTLPNLISPGCGDYSPAPKPAHSYWSAPAPLPAPQSYNAPAGFSGLTLLPLYLFFSSCISFQFNTIFKRLITSRAPFLYTVTQISSSSSS